MVKRPGQRNVGPTKPLHDTCGPQLLALSLMVQVCNHLKAATHSVSYQYKATVPWSGTGTTSATLQSLATSMRPAPHSASQVPSEVCHDALHAGLHLEQVPKPTDTLLLLMALNYDNMAESAGTGSRAGDLRAGRGPQAQLPCRAACSLLTSISRCKELQQPAGEE